VTDGYPLKLLVVSLNGLYSDFKYLCDCDLSSWNRISSYHHWWPETWPRRIHVNVKTISNDAAPLLTVWTVVRNHRNKHIGESSNPVYRYTGVRWNKRRRSWPSRCTLLCSVPRFSGSCAGPRDSPRVYYDGHLRWYQRITPVAHRLKSSII